VTPYQEHGGAEQATNMLADMANEYLDLRNIKSLMTDIQTSGAIEKSVVKENNIPKVRIGILKEDSQGCRLSILLPGKSGSA
jgi:hypothetical protein